MTYPYGDPGRYPTPSPAACSGYWPQPTGATNQHSSPAHLFLWAVVALGLATYLINCSAVSQPGGIGWGVRFSTLAAVVAALGLLPRQSAQTRPVAVLAVMGFLEALSRLTIGDQSPGWASIIIVVLNALQALAAFGALLTQPSTLSTAERQPDSYDVYAYYAQAARQYYATNPPAPQQPVQGQATAQADVAARVRAQQSAAERDALYTEYVSAQEPGPNPAKVSPHPGGRPQTSQPVTGSGTTTSGTAERGRPGNDPAVGTPTQSPPW